MMVCVLRSWRLAAEMSQHLQIRGHDSGFPSRGSGVSRILRSLFTSEDELEGEILYRTIELSDSLSPFAFRPSPIGVFSSVQWLKQWRHVYKLSRWLSSVGCFGSASERNVAGRHSDVANTALSLLPPQLTSCKVKRMVGWIGWMEYIYKKKCFKSLSHGRISNSVKWMHT